MLLSSLCFSIEVNIPVMVPDLSFRLVVAAAVQGVFGRGASPMEIIPMTLTAVTNLAIIWVYIATMFHHLKAAISALKH